MGKHLLCENYWMQMCTHIFVPSVIEVQPHLTNTITLVKWRIGTHVSFHPFIKTSVLLVDRVGSAYTSIGNHCELIGANLTDGISPLIIFAGNLYIDWFYPFKIFYIFLSLSNSIFFSIAFLIFSSIALVYANPLIVAERIHFFDVVIILIE